MVDYVKAKGGEVRTGVRLQRIELDSGGRVAGYRLSDGSLETADLYVSAMPGMAAITFIDTVVSRLGCMIICWCCMSDSLLTTVDSLRLCVPCGALQPHLISSCSLGDCDWVAWDYGLCEGSVYAAKPCSSLPSTHPGSAEQRRPDSTLRGKEFLCVQWTRSSRCCPRPGKRSPTSASSMPWSASPSSMCTCAFAKGK